MTILAAWVIALGVGVGLYALAGGFPRTRAGMLAASGYAVPLGLLGCAMVVQLPSTFGMTTLPGHLWAWPMVLLVALAVILGRVARRARLAATMPVPFAAPTLKSSDRLWIGLILALIVIRAMWLFEEAWLRPLFGWDAWLAWSAKAKAWLLSGQAADFVDGPAWLADTAGTTRTSLAHHYPELLSWLQVWLSSAGGSWNEPVINSAWPMLWLALVAGCYGQWRLLGVAPLTAAIGAYLLASLPLANVHAALPGYADLWVATIFVFAVLSLVRWREHRERGQLWLALGLTALLPMLKLEGMVWATALLALVLWYALAGHRRSVRFGAAILCVIVLVAVSWLLGLPWLHQLTQLLRGVHHGGSVFDVLTSTASGLFTQDNWHLLWYLLPVMVAWRWRVMRRSTALSGVGLLLLGALSLLLALFLGTSAGQWAESFTAVNRLVLHLAPMAISLMVLLMREPLAGKPVERATGVEPAADTVPRAV